MKKCFKCNKSKPLGEFYPHSEMKDGHFNKCKDCTKRDVRERELIKSQDPSWVAAERERNRIKQAHYRKLGLAKDTSNARKHAWRKRNPVKSKAHGAAARAFKKLILKAPINCQGCNKRQWDVKHHPDYSQPLLVWWLCHSCHGKAHRKDNPLRIAA